MRKLKAAPPRKWRFGRPPTLDGMDPIAAVRDRLTARDLPVVLELDLAHGILSSAPSNPRDALRALHAPTMRAVRDGLRRARTDDRVAGVVVHVGTCQITPAQADEVAALLVAVGRDKPTLAWSETFGELTSGLFGYRLAAHTQQIWLQPSGTLAIQGVALGVTLFRGSLDKVGITPEYGQRYEYKTAANQFTAREVTEPQREMMQRIADSILDETVARVADRRHLDPTAVRSAVDAAPLNATDALAAGLVDRIGYRDEVYAWINENWGAVLPGSDDPQVHLQYVHRYAKESGGGALLKQLRDRNRPGIAVVGVQGGITTGVSRQSPLQGQSAGADTVCAQLRAAGRDDQVKAVVLRVDSPGGSYVASDSIRREVVRLRESGRPVVASMGDVAGSGGYFVSMAANEIVANPTTLTGSIGVLAGKFVTAGLSDKLGLVQDQMAAGARATMFSGLTGFTEDQWDVLNHWLDEVYADFTGKAAADRGMALDVLEPLARGRVWTGADAAERGLVDHLGGIDLALDRACALAGVDRDAVGLRGGPAFSLLAQLRPSESSESPRGSSRMPAGQGSLPLLGAGPEALWRTALSLAGVEVPGVLSMPFRVTLG